MSSELRELWKYRELLLMIAIRDIKVRYKQSLMGFLWAILMPLLIISAGILVRYAYAIASQKPLGTEVILTVAIKSVPWAFLVSSIRFSCQSLIVNTNLVTKVYFPKEVFPIAAVLSQLFDLAIAGGVLLLVLVVAKVGLSLQLLWVGPLLLTLTVLATGIGFLVSAGALYFRDVKYIVEVFLTFAIFFTPVFYDVNMLGDKGRWLLLNPVSPILEAFGSIARGQAPRWDWVYYSIAFSVIIIVAAYALFKKLEPTFAENI